MRLGRSDKAAQDSNLKALIEGTRGAANAWFPFPRKRMLALLVTHPAAALLPHSPILLSMA